MSRYLICVFCLTSALTFPPRVLKMSLSSIFGLYRPFFLSRRLASACRRVFLLVVAVEFRSMIAPSSNVSGGLIVEPSSRRRVAFKSGRVCFPVEHGSTSSRRARSPPKFRAVWSRSIPYKFAPVSRNKITK